MSAVSVEEVRRVAELANLELTEAEERSMQRDLNAILSHVAELAELETTDIESMAQVGNLLERTADERGGSLRADAVRLSIDRRAVMAAAPESDGRFFKVPKVIER